MHLLLCQLNKEYRVAHLSMKDGAPTNTGLRLIVDISNCSPEELRMRCLNATPTKDERVLESIPNYLETHDAADFLHLLKDNEIVAEDMFDFVFNPYVDWIYVLDLDSEKFEIYIRNKDNNKVYPDNRFYYMEKFDRYPAIKLYSFDMRSMPSINELSQIEAIIW